MMSIHSITELFLRIWNGGGVGDIEKCLEGVNMRELQIYIKNREKLKKQYTESGRAGVVSKLGGGYLPL